MSRKSSRWVKMRRRLAIALKATLTLCVLFKRFVSLPWEVWHKGFAKKTCTSGLNVQPVAPFLAPTLNLSLHHWSMPPALLWDILWFPENLLFRTAGFGPRHFSGQLLKAQVSFSSAPCKLCSKTWATSREPNDFSPIRPSSKPSTCPRRSKRSP